MAEEQAPNLTWVQKHGRWLAAIAVVGMGLAYVLGQINPETVMKFRVEQAVNNTKSEIRWCLSKLAWSDKLSRELMLKCAD